VSKYIAIIVADVTGMGSESIPKMKNCKAVGRISFAANFAATQANGANRYFTYKSASVSKELSLNYVPSPGLETGAEDVEGLYYCAKDRSGKTSNDND